MSVRPPPMRWCTRCCYPASSAVPLEFDDDGVCSGCRVADQRCKVDWDQRLALFKTLLEGYRRTSTTGYDLIIPVSGGKDSFFQVHTIRELGYRPLLVTYNGNNYTEVGLRNLQRMRDAFGFDHVFYTPSVRVLKVLNRLGMIVMGDPNWHAHAGIFTYPIREAVLRKIPLMLWGEHGYADLGGMHSYNDFVEFTYRFRHEHALRGYEWTDMIRAAKVHGEKLDAFDLAPWRYPTDDEIDAVGVRGVYLSNYVRWDANDHGPMMERLYGFEGMEFERTYRRLSNLDDMHENGLHDYMKWVKFGYGRCTDHVCKDIRAGLMTRAHGIAEIKARDHVVPSDLYRWLDYVGWTHTQFDALADKFRDPRVWRRAENGDWTKDEIQ